MFIKTCSEPVMPTSITSCIQVGVEPYFLSSKRQGFESILGGFVLFKLAKDKSLVGLRRLLSSATMVAVNAMCFLCKELLLKI